MESKKSCFWTHNHVHRVIQLAFIQINVGKPFNRSHDALFQFSVLPQGVCASYNVHMSCLDIKDFNDTTHATVNGPTAHRYMAAPISMRYNH